ncbi:LysR family transcriptional regulator [Pseudomonas cichorii]|uniref:LysR family transcriptional regulator n=1 Tax=Pseudomonas cichorii TaxID=36746 RepID=UPI000F003B0A|nr:LysR family transcriptional regulator [Pseudomonas cichorii]
MLQDEMGSLAAFAAVAEACSFTRAAGRLGTSQSALSHKIRRLEARLGVRLLTRTTRSVAPTVAGEKLLATLRPALAEIEAQLGALTDIRDKPAGSLRITTADHAAESILWPALHRLLPDYPDIQIEVNVDNGFVDIVAERYDAGIRLGNNLDKDMIAVPIGPAERSVVVGSPVYLATHPAPVTPEQLAAHQCINRQFPTLGGITPWQFVKDGRQTQVRVSGQLAFNRPEMIREAALAGFGLGCLLQSQVIDHLKEGTLVSVLEDWSPQFPGYYLYYPSRRQNTPAFQLLVEALRYREDTLRAKPSERHRR